MDTIRSTRLWQRTLGREAENEVEAEFLKRLASSFESFRERVEQLAGEISKDLRQLTVHDITHIDALWETADTVIGDDYPLTPTEGFVLGAAFLLHDLGLALASYPDGQIELREDPSWKDAIARSLRKRLGRIPNSGELRQPEPDIVQQADEEVLRLRHAQRAEDLAVIGFRHRSRDLTYYLLENFDLRQTYGRLAGRIAYSHWWSIDQIVDDPHLNREIGAFPKGPTDWTIEPLKLALVLRVTDACHLDARRAPGFLRALRKPDGVAEHHWRIQEFIQKPRAKNHRVEFTSPNPVPAADKEAWWVGYDLVQLADRELRDAEIVLSELSLPPFAVHGVAGCTSARSLAKYIPTAGWVPVDTSIRSSDVGALVRKIGGEGLYGRNPSVPLRELIQNARDAVVGRRLKESRQADWGTITVRLIDDNGIDRLEVDDTGLGMSEDLLSGPLLDFGTSYWESYLSSKEHEGLTARGFEPQGTYGIGFFSVFMLADRIRIITRRPEDSTADTRVLEFDHGLSARPTIRKAAKPEFRSEAGTCVQLWLRHSARDNTGLLSPNQPTSEWLDGPKSRKKEPWHLSNLCQWLCPALDVTLQVDADGLLQTSVEANDWLELAPLNLFRRLLLHRNDVDDLVAHGVLNDTAERISEIKNHQGQIIGRAALSDPIISSCRSLAGEPMNIPGVHTAGCFRSFAWMHFPGLLLGRPSVAARTQATPLAYEHPKRLAEWATEQAEIYSQTGVGVVAMASFAGLVRRYNGDTCNLPIVEYEGRILSFNELVQQNLPDEIELYSANWGVAGSPPPASRNAQGAIGVSSGRMKSLGDGVVDYDYKERSDHPRWRQYWMSLWGATIEAIATAWKCRLSEVLDSSTIHIEGWERRNEAGREFHRQLIDKIVRPR